MAQDRDQVNGELTLGAQIPQDCPHDPDPAVELPSGTKCGEAIDALNFCPPRPKDGNRLHPCPQPRLPPPTHKIGGEIIDVKTAEGYFEPVDPFCYPPGTNLLPTIYSNVFDSFGHEMINTLPSTPRVPYNLHDGEPVVDHNIDPTSPVEDLRAIFDRVPELITGESAHNYWIRIGDCANPDLPFDPTPHLIDAEHVTMLLQRGIDILEGNPVMADPPNASTPRAYSGFPLLHYTGPLKIKSIQVQRDGAGNIERGYVDVHQIWYDSHIESDTAFLDLKKIILKDKDGKPRDIPWTINYKLDVLNRGKDDFAPTTMYFDDPAFQPPLTGDPNEAEQSVALVDVGEDNPKPALPNVAMDQTFFPIEEGTRTTLKIKMAPARYFNLTYTWGWRQHPPRVQVIENAGKKFPPSTSGGHEPRFLTCYEIETFGANPRESQQKKLAAIAKIGDLAPEKRMWCAFTKALAAVSVPDPDYRETLRQVNSAWCAFHEWRNRTRLPSGVKVDPETDLTLLYVNNTIYGELRDGGVVDFPQWRMRPRQLKVTLINGDYFEHGYLNIDFGGARGWESQFKSSTKVGGSGCRFGFGRFYWSFNVNPMQPIILPGAVPGNPNLPKQKVFITYNFEPSRRIRFYQFDPLHHDVAVFSLH